MQVRLVKSADVDENWRLSTPSIVNLARSQIYRTFVVLQGLPLYQVASGHNCRNAPSSAQEYRYGLFLSVAYSSLIKTFTVRVH